jgi:DNA-directed RNA polymerase specialized sigma24 family protein
VLVEILKAMRIKKTNKIKICPVTKEIQLKIYDLLHHNCKETITRYVLSCGGTYEDVEDIIHDTFEYLTRPGKIKRIKQGKIHTYTYIVTSARNIWSKEIRRIERNTLIPVDCDFGDDSKEFLEAEKRQKQYRLYWKHYISLSAECRQILRYEFHKTPNKVAAAKMGLTEDAYKKRKERTLEALHSKIKQDPLYLELLPD